MVERSPYKADVARSSRVGPTMEGDIYVSDHAVERFVKRHVPHMTFTAAKTLLIRRARDAVALKEKTVKGDHQWRITDPDVILVGKYVQNRIICKTVLPEPENFGIPEEEMDILREERMAFDSRVIEEEKHQVELETRLLNDQLTRAQRFDLEKQRISAEKKIGLFRCQIIREYLATKNREITMDKELDGALGSKKQLAKALREAITFIMKLENNRDADFALAEIQRINPEFLSKKFLKKD